jgi:protein ImuB
MWSSASASVASRPGRRLPMQPALPIAALRLADETIAGFFRFGFDRIEQLLAAPRAPLTVRFGPEVVLERRAFCPPCA